MKLTILEQKRKDGQYFISVYDGEPSDNNLVDFIETNSRLDATEFALRWSNKGKKYYVRWQDKNGEDYKFDPKYDAPLKREGMEPRPFTNMSGYRRLKELGYQQVELYGNDFLRKKYGGATTVFVDCSTGEVSYFNRDTQYETKYTDMKVTDNHSADELDSEAKAGFLKL